MTQILLDLLTTAETHLLFLYVLSVDEATPLEMEHDYACVSQNGGHGASPGLYGAKFE